MGGQRHVLAALPPRKDTGYRTLGGTQNRSGRLRKISPAPGFDSRTEEAEASRYTDRGIPAHAITVALPSIARSLFVTKCCPLESQKRRARGRDNGNVHGGNTTTVNIIVSTTVT